MTNFHLLDALRFFGAPPATLPTKKIFPVAWQAPERVKQLATSTFPWSGSPKLDGVSISFTRAPRTVWRNMAGLIPLRSKNSSAFCGMWTATIRIHQPSLRFGKNSKTRNAQRIIWQFRLCYVQETVVRHLAESNCGKGAQVIVEKPFGHDLASAQELNEVLLATFDEADIFRIDHYLGKRAVNNVLAFRFANTFVEAFWNRNYIESVEITMAEDFGVQGRGGFYDQTGTIRDVVQNHLFQVLSNLTMEPPVRSDSESIRDEKVKVLKAIPPIEEKNLVRGQFRGYRDENGVAKDSQTETFAAVKLEINSWRWKGVPFYIRAGKCLPTTRTEIVAKFRKPPTPIPDSQLVENHLRLRLSPEITIAMGMMNLAPNAEGLVLQSGEMVASHSPRADEMDAYERVLGAAMDGDSTLFAREDYVEEAWRIVEPVLKKNTPIYQYTPNTWGPQEVERVTPPGGWSNPDENKAFAVASEAA